MSKIPKILFTVWFGQVLPLQYQNNLIKLKELNPDYQLMLYTDSSTLTEEAYADILTFCTDNQIELKDLQSLSFGDTTPVVEELTLAKTQYCEKLRKLHYVRASDIMRIIALYEHGGIYLDTDIQAHKGFGDIPCETGLSLTTFLPESDYEFLLGEFYYDCIAAMPKQAVFLEALALHKSDQRSLKLLQNNRLYQYDSSRPALRAYVLATTGSVLLYSSTIHQLQHSDDLKAKKDILYASHFITRKNDNSWLPETLTPFTKLELYFVHQLVKKLHKNRARILDTLDAMELCRLEETILNILSPEGFPEVITEDARPKIFELRFFPKNIDEILRQNPLKIPTQMPAFHPTDTPDIPPLSDDHFSKTYIPNIQIDITPCTISKDITIDFPIKKEYKHRNTLGWLSPFNFFANLINGVRWDATRTERIDTINARLMERPQKITKQSLK